MFRCQMCEKVSGSGTKSNKIVVASRTREYRGNIEDFPQRRFGRFREPRKPRDRGGKGSEIVKELMVCGTCAEVHQKKEAAAAAIAKEEARRLAAIAASMPVDIAIDDDDDDE